MKSQQRKVGKMTNKEIDETIYGQMVELVPLPISISFLCFKRSDGLTEKDIEGSLKRLMQRNLVKKVKVNLNGPEPGNPFITTFTFTYTVTTPHEIAQSKLDK